jgi:DNA-binding MarR family transcriptional regulator
MSESIDAIRDAVFEMRELLRLLAEPAVAARDRALREELLRIVGKSDQRANSVLLMDGTRSQTEIRRVTGMDSGNLSVYVKKLVAANLIDSDTKNPKLLISIPSNFFETDGEANGR